MIGRPGRVIFVFLRGVRTDDRYQNVASSGKDVTEAMRMLRR